MNQELAKMTLREFAPAGIDYWLALSPWERQTGKREQYFVLWPPLQHPQNSDGTMVWYWLELEGTVETGVAGQEWTWDGNGSPVNLNKECVSKIVATKLFPEELA